MAVLALCSAKSSPGVTTTAVGIGATWATSRNPVIVEADPAGGDLAIRFGFEASPNLVSFATAARRDNSKDLLLQHTQETSGGLAVLVAPPSSVQTRSALSMLGADFFSHDTDRDFIVDVGRIDTTGLSSSIAATSDLVVLCARPILAELHHLAASLDALGEVNRDVVMLLIGDGPYGRGEIEEVIKTEVIGHLPFDARGAAGLCGGAISERGLGRSPLVRALREVSETLAGRIIPEVDLAAAS